MLKYVEGKLTVTDEQKLSDKLSWSVKHFNNLDLDNPLVGQVLERFKNVHRIVYIIQKLKVFYWTRCDTISEFNEFIGQRLKENITLEKLVS